MTQERMPSKSSSDCRSRHHHHQHQPSGTHLHSCAGLGSGRFSRSQPSPRRAIAGTSRRSRAAGRLPPTRATNIYPAANHGASRHDPAALAPGSRAVASRPIGAEVDEIRQEARRNTRGRFEQWAKNPTCEANTLSAVHNVRLDKAAGRRVSAPSFGQSPFAITRGNRFEAGLFFDEAQRLRAAWSARGAARGLAGFPRPSPQDERWHAVVRRRRGARRDRGLAAADRSRPGSAESVVAAPMIRIPKGVILPEALLIIDVVTVR